MGLEALAIGGAMGSGVLNANAARADARAIEQASKLNAKATLQESSSQAARIRKEGRRAIGQQTAFMGQSGLQQTGSPLELIVQNAAEVERQAKEQELAGQYAASVERERGETAIAQGRRVSAASLLGGATQAAYYGYRLL